MRTHLRFLIGAMLVPALALAANPTAFTERSKVVATGEELHLYCLPTTTSGGATKYYDVTLTLDVLNTGKPAATASVTAVVCPNVRSSAFVPGGYKGSTPGFGGVTCTLDVSPFAGHVEGVLNCYADYTPHATFTATWYTGPLADNPFAAELTAAGLDMVPGNEEFAWGKVGADTRYTWFGCFNATPGDLIAARQSGNSLTMINYKHDSTSDCQASVLKAVP